MFREIQNIDEMKAYAQEVATDYKGGRLLVLLDGPMGAGKTQFTRFLLEALGSAEVTSPSFAIHNRYETPRGEVDHLDLYRIDNVDDLESTAFWDLFVESDGVVVIEWSDRLKDWGVYTHLPRNWPLLKLRFDIPTREENPDGNRRQILVQKQAGSKR
jgi:tRNA threonylcarbamoyladenosine biosynthesis protein TsaE